MANQKAQQISIPFEAPLNMNKNVTDVKSFIGFNERNSPIFGGCLSPLFFKTDTGGANTVYDRSGNKYTLSNGVLYKNGTQLMTVNTTGYSKETVTNISTVSSITVNPINVDEFKYNTDGSLAYTTIDNNIVTCHYQYNGTEYTNTISATATPIYGTGIHFDGNHVFFIEASYYSSQGVFISVAATDYNFSTNTWTTMTMYNNTDTPMSLVPGGALSNTFTVYNNTYFWMPSYNMPITGALKVKFNFGLDHSGLTLMSILMFTENNLYTGKNSQFSAYNLCIDYNVMGLRVAYYKELIGSDRTISTSVRYPNVVIDGEDRAIFIGPTYEAVSGTDMTIYPIANISSIYVLTSSITRKYNNGRSDIGAGTVYVDTDISSSVSSFTTNYYNGYYPDSNLSSYLVMGDHIRCACSRNGIYGVIYDTAVGLIQNTGVTLLTNNNMVSYTGGAYQVGRWNVLFNLNNVFGISSSSNILLTEWTSVSGSNPIQIDQNGYLLYADSSTNTYYRLKDNAANSLSLVENRYIVVNTTSTINCWDITNDASDYYATDWNNRYFPGSGTNSLSTYGSYYTAQNAGYRITGSQLCSLELPLSIVAGQGSGTGVIDTPIEGLKLEYYTSGATTASLATSAYYNSTLSYQNSSITSNSNSSLSGAQYEAAATLISPNIFTVYNTSYTNQDMVVSNGTAYPLTYYNNKAILLYSLSGGLENVSKSFIIQGQTYCISDNKVYKTTYSSGSLSLSQAIVDVFGLQFLGASPYMALFFSQINRTIYSFTGDAILNAVQEANVISSIYLTAYDTATYKFYLCSNNGLYIVSGDNINHTPAYKLGINNITNVQFTLTGPIIITDSSVIQVSYYPQDGYTDNRLKISTCYYGSGNNQVGIIDCWYIRLYSEQAIAGTLSVSVNTLTNEGCATEKKIINIKATDWDKLTNTYYIRYQPKMQRGVGASLNLESDFPISSLSASYTQDTTVQVSANNI